MARNSSASQVRNRKTSKTQRPRRRRGRANAVAQLIRGVVLEGLGVAVLVMLYLMIQSTSANDVLEKGEQPSVGVESQQVRTAAIHNPQQLPGSYLRPPSTANNGYAFDRDPGNNSALQRHSIGEWR